MYLETTMTMKSDMHTIVLLPYITHKTYHHINAVTFFYRSTY